MTIKIGTLTEWSYLNKGDAIIFDSELEHNRLVRLHVNLERQTSFYFNTPKRKEARFLCTAPAGIETIEFYISESISVFPQKDAGSVLYDTSEYATVHFEVDDPEIFTKIVQRRDRNPEFEEMMYRAQLNMEARFAAQSAELERQLARMKEHENEKTNNQSATSGGGETLSGSSLGELKKSGGDNSSSSGSGPEGDAND